MKQLHAHIRHQNETEPQATEYHTRGTRVQHRNCESGLAKACCTQVGPANAAGYVEMTCTNPHRCSQKQSVWWLWHSGNSDKQHQWTAMQLPLL